MGQAHLPQMSGRDGTNWRKRVLDMTLTYIFHSGFESCTSLVNAFERETAYRWQQNAGSLEEKRRFAQNEHKQHKNKINHWAHFKLVQLYLWAGWCCMFPYCKDTMALDDGKRHNLIKILLIQTLILSLVQKNTNRDWLVFFNILLNLSPYLIYAIRFLAQIPY